MATTVGFVQRLVIFDTGLTCAFIGPSPTNTAALFVQNSAGDTPAQATFKASIVDGLSVAMTTRQQVQANHGDTSSSITSLALGPG
jgi:hypothetical protein